MSQNDPGLALAALDSLSNGVLLVDSSGNFAHCNRSARRMLDWSDPEIPESTPSGTLSPEILQAVEEAGAGRARLGISGSVRTSSGATLSVRVNVSPVQDRPGMAVVSFALLGSLEHRERRRLLEERLRALGGLTEGVAHHLRNPLTGVGAGVEVLGRALVGVPEQLENLAAVRREIDRMNGILEDMLRITHPPRLARAPVDVAALVRACAQDLAVPGASSRVGAVVQGDPGQPWLDPEQLRSAVMELARNALEASPAGEAVELEVLLATPEPDRMELGKPLLRIVIRDRGPGLPGHIRQALFEPFRSTRPAAKGLGLYLVRQVASRHGGELRLEDRAGGGTQAVLDLPWEMRNDD